MSALVLPRTSRIHVCDYCDRVQLPEGRWIACHSLHHPPAQHIEEDICPECCASYANFLLAPTPETNECELAMPAFRHRPR
jgi:hypothetical protein